LSVEHLRAVYEVVTPMNERAVEKTNIDRDARDDDEASAPVRRRRGMR
jgi:hypothetical protein